MDRNLDHSDVLDHIGLEGKSVNTVTTSVGCINGHILSPVVVEYDHIRSPFGSFDINERHRLDELESLTELKGD